jgi:phosphoenolpyruvate carboxykinase (GTP)
MEISNEILNEENLKKLEDLNNEKVMQIVEKYIKHCKPSKVTVITDSQEDIDYVRNKALENKEESKLEMEGHTIHYDGYNDQARDKANTKILVPQGKELGKHLNTIDREEGLNEVMKILDGIMEGKEMFVRFFCLGPLNSEFSVMALQLTDSSYVCHSEDILYRVGYEMFKTKGKDHFFHFVHSAGKLDEKGNTIDVDKRRIYTDLEEERVLTVNNQYAGNSLGLKKLALRLAINKSNKEDWLAEHMFVMGVKPQDKQRTTYFTGAYPSACGKTSTAMIPGQSVIGDDIAYLKVWEDGTLHAANIEQGIFGIITDVNAKDDPFIYKCLTSPRELVISNVLQKDGKPYWLNMGVETPKEGYNHSGEWQEGKKGENNKEIPLAHKNARYTLRIKELENADKEAENPEGVKVDGILYGGRDSDTNVPICQSLSWSHGVFMGAAIESETTAATLGAEGQLAHSPMANLDFLVVPLGLYIKNHLKLGERLDKKPLIFYTNYFLKEDGQFLNEKVDKKVWVLWAEGRVHTEYEAIETPIGLIPKYEDLKDLFKQVFDREYTKEEYVKQFSLRVNNLLAKLDRIETIYKEHDVPNEFMEHIDQQKERLKKIEGDVISPFDF